MFFTPVYGRLVKRRLVNGRLIKDGWSKDGWSRGPNKLELSCEYYEVTCDCIKISPHDSQPL